MDEMSGKAQVLKELRSENEALLSFGDALDAKLNMLFGSGTLVLSLFSTLNLLDPGSEVSDPGDRRIDALAPGTPAIAGRPFKGWLCALFSP